MKKIIQFLMLSLLITSCSKEDEMPAVKPFKNIGGSYEADAKYYYSKNGYVIDTVYKTSFEITEQDSDTIHVEFLNINNVFSKGKLYFKPNQTSEDTLEYETPYNSPERGGAIFYFYPKSKKFLYKYRISFTGASGFGGITHTIHN